MLNRSQKLIESSEKLFYNNKTSKTALRLIYAYWLCDKLDENHDYLDKAYHIAVTMYHTAHTNENLFFAITFLHIEKGDIDKSEELLEKFNHYKNYYKNNNITAYSQLLYLFVRSEHVKKNHRGAKKYFKLLQEVVEEKKRPEMYLLLGDLSLSVFQDSETAGEYFLKAYKGGNRSSILFFNLYHYFNDPYLDFSATEELLMPFINWAYAHNLNLTTILKKYFGHIKFSLTDHSIVLAEKLFNAYNEEWILKDICKMYLNNYDYSLNAYHIFKKAVDRQIYLNDLSNAIVYAAYKNDMEDLNTYTVKSFLMKENQNEELLAFIYHLIISDPKHQPMLSEYVDKIAAFGENLKNAAHNRYYNSIMKFLIERGSATEEQEKFIFTQIFLREVKVKSKRIKYIWVYEKEKKEMTPYEVEKHKVHIKVSSDDFVYYCFSERQKEIVDEELHIVKMVEVSDMELYKKFYEKGYDSVELQIALSKYYLELPEKKEESLEILNKTLLGKDISRSFRMLICANLGNIFAQKGEYKRALTYFGSVDEAYLNDADIEQMLQVLITMKEYDKACEVILKKAHVLSDRMLFYCCKKLLSEKGFHKQIAHICYELILKSWYDRELLDVVLENYEGSQSEWRNLSKSLSDISIRVESLDELIIKDGIYMHKFDKDLQEIFVYMYGFGIEELLAKDVLEEFLYYCMYEMMVNSVVLIPEMVECLEKIYLSNKTPLLGYALSHVYIHQNMMTQNATEIIQSAVNNMEQEEILFPVFKKIQNKNWEHEYVEKYFPFMYQGLPEKNIYLNYKIDDEETYRVRKMNYERFGYYMDKLPLFYGEKITYYYTEEFATGNIATKETVFEHNKVSISENKTDLYYVINNAMIYEQLLDFEKIEQLVKQKLESKKNIRGKIL